jgi:hypothetical protein
MRACWPPPPPEASLIRASLVSLLVAASLYRLREEEDPFDIVLCICMDPFDLILSTASDVILSTRSDLILCAGISPRAGDCVACS